jgi:hypothetical protein
MRQGCKAEESVLGGLRMKRSSFILFVLSALLLIGSLVFASVYYKGYRVVHVEVNGKLVQGDVPAIIIDGRTMVPLRFVSEALGVHVDWDQERMTAILSTEEKSAEREKISTRRTYTVNDLKEVLEFDYNEKVFTIYAFLNYTGFKDNNGMPFHPVRQAIINDIKAINPKLTAPNFLADYEGSADYFDYMGIVMEGPPYFKPIYLSQVDPALRNQMGLLEHIQTYKIDVLLAEFYREANIKELYEKYRAVHEEEIRRVSPMAYEELVHIFNVMNLELIDHKIIVDLSKTFLMAAGRAEVFTNFPDVSRDGAILMAYGLNKDNMTQGSVFVHEVLHLYVDPILAKHRSRVFSFIDRNDVKGAGPYDLFAFVNESFIRALENSRSKVFVNHDAIAFPMTQKILDYYHAYHNPETDTLEDFLMDALRYFSN